MSRSTPKGPRIIIDFTDELVRQLSAENIARIIENYIASEASVDSVGAAQILCYSADEFRKNHARKIPVAELGSGTRGNRYRIKDIVAYREKRTVYPKEATTVSAPLSPPAPTPVFRRTLEPEEVPRKLSKNGKMYPTKYRKSPKWW